MSIGNDSDTSNWRERMKKEKRWGKGRRKEGKQKTGPLVSSQPWQKAKKCPVKGRVGQLQPE